LDIGNKRMIGPIRSLPHNDFFHYKGGHELLGNKAPSLPFMELVRDFDKPHIADLDKSLVKNTEYDRALANRAKDAPVFSVPRVHPQIRISRSNLVKIVEYQANIERASVISVPDPGRRWYDNLWERTMEAGMVAAYILRPSREFEVVMPIISLDQPIEYVEKKVNWLIEKEINAIGFRVASNYGPRLIKAVDILRNHREEEIRDIWIHLTNLSKQMKNLSQPHLSVLARVDTISTYKFNPKIARILAARGKEPDKTDALWDVPNEPSKVSVNKSLAKPTNKKKRRPPKGDFLDRDLLAYLTDSQHISSINHGKECQCRLHQNCCKDENMLKHYIGSDNRTKIIQVHDMHASNREFEAIQRAITESTLLDYFKGKSRVILEKSEVKKRFKVKL
jgi:hypothetical protein